jgi:hypothetical protein
LAGNGSRPFNGRFSSRQTPPEYIPTIASAVAWYNGPTSFTPAQNPGDGHTTSKNAAGMLAGTQFGCAAATWPAVPARKLSVAPQVKTIPH